MSQAFYRKWRPRTFDQVVAQDHVTQTLRNALQQSRIVHAYLFSGPRGTGKTSTARILAKAVNCLSDAEERPCNHCVMCQAIDDGRAMDLIEIDAASHTGVDHIRELRDKISFAPAEARYKFYIIDEAHMLSPSAFNALLKTLEEPPAHAILVLATTEAYKIPATVISRCQRFDFRRIPLSAMVDRLQQIAGDEGLQAEDGVFELIARQSTGSMRDAESLLDQLATFTSSEITLAQVQTILGTTSSEAVGDLVQQVNAGDLSGGLGTVNRALAEGADPRQLSKDLLEYLRGLLLVKSTGHAPPELTKEQAREMTSQASRLSLDHLVRTIKIFNQAALDLKDSTQPQLPLELALVEAILEAGPTKVSEGPADSTSGDLEQTPSAPPRAVSGPDDAPPTGGDRSSLEGSSSDDVAVQPAQDVPVAGGGQFASGGLQQLRDAWAQVVAVVNRRSMHLAAVVRGCPPMAIEEDVVILHAGSPFHKQKLESDRARQLVEEGISETLGQPYRVKCVLQSDAPAQGTNEEDLERLIDDPMIRAGLELGGEIGTVEKRAP